MKEAQLVAKGDIKNGGLKAPDLGLEFDNDRIKSKWFFSAEKEPNYDFEWSYRACNGWTFGGHQVGQVFAPLRNADLQLGFAGTFKDTGVQYGMRHTSVLNNFAFSQNVYDFFFNHRAGPNTVGAHINYNQDSKTFSSTLGLAMNHDDHTWKFRFQNDGLLRAALQWQLHRVAKATVNTRVNVKDIAGGKINALPWNLTVELKY